MKNFRPNLLLAAALLAAGATTSAQNLSMAFADPLSSVDPQLNNHAGDRSLALHFWDSIINSRDGGKLEPALAASWRSLDDRTWEFKLRPDVTFVPMPLLHYPNLPARLLARAPELRQLFAGIEQLILVRITEQCPAALPAHHRRTGTEREHSSSDDTTA